MRDGVVSTIQRVYAYDASYPPDPRGRWRIQKTADEIMELLRQNARAIRWCKTHNEATYEGDEPTFCAYGEARWESALCVVSPAMLLLEEAPD